MTWWTWSSQDVPPSFGNAAAISGSRLSISFYDFRPHATPRLPISDPATKIQESGLRLEQFEQWQPRKTQHNWVFPSAKENTNEGISSCHFWWGGQPFAAQTTPTAPFLKLTGETPPENRPGPKKKTSIIPTIHFQVLWLLVSRRVIFCSYIYYIYIYICSTWTQKNFQKPEGGSIRGVKNSSLAVKTPSCSCTSRCRNDPCPACVEQHKTLKVAFPRGSWGVAWLKQKHPSRETWNCESAFFCKIFVSTNPSYYASRSKPTWMIYMFVGHFFQFCDHSANLDGLRNGSLVVRILYKV